MKPLNEMEEQFAMEEHYAALYEERSENDYTPKMPSVETDEKLFNGYPVDIDEEEHTAKFHYDNGYYLEINPKTKGFQWYKYDNDEGFKAIGLEYKETSTNFMQNNKNRFGQFSNVLESENVPNDQAKLKIFYNNIIKYVRDNPELEAILSYNSTRNELISLKNNPTGKKELIEASFIFEEDFNIITNQDDTSKKYYWNNESNEWVLLDANLLGILIEKQYKIRLADDGLKTLLQLFRNAKKPNNDAIRFNNCVLDTKTWERLNITTFTKKRIEFDYQPFENLKDKPITLMEQELKRILIPANKPSDTVIYKDFLQRVGAAFLKDNIYKFMILYYGEGNNGRSVLLNVLDKLFNNLSISIKPSQLEDTFFQRMLSNKNVMIIDELNKKSFPSERVGIIKDMTGRGYLDVRRMYSDEERIRVRGYGVPFMGSNNLPDVSFSEKAYYDRLILVTLPNTFSTNISDVNPEQNVLPADTFIEDRLLNDKEGMEWLISKSIELIKERGGDFPIKQSADDTILLMRGENPIYAFIESNIIVTSNDDDIMSILDIEFHLLRWLIRNGVPVSCIDTSQNKIRQKIGYVLKNVYPRSQDFKVMLRNGNVGYKRFAFFKDDKDKPSEYIELKETVKRLEEEYFTL